ncbi:MAG: helix-turn-helix transcriptional regulator [Eubacteriales bacterium]|nr:helix-turn-helix transcriptional regulator [Eubacteriales bacterium]
MEKVLRSLSMTPDMLMGNLKNPYIQAKAFRSALKIKAEEICAATGIPMERLRKIECGEEATLAELRDIAHQLGTGVNSILGEGVFAPQAAAPGDCLLRSCEEKAIKGSGFWGHVGVLPANEKEYLWYPITAHTRSMIYRMQLENRLVIPCMNNRLLYLNTQNISSIVLLDDACDSPNFANWDSGVDCGAIPPVIYESLSDFFLQREEGVDPDEFSPRFWEIMKGFVKSEGWNEENTESVLHAMVVHYANGQTMETDVDFNGNETLSAEVETIYDFEEALDEESFLLYSDSNGAEIMLQSRNIAVLDLPLTQTEDAIIRRRREERAD